MSRFEDLYSFSSNAEQEGPEGRCEGVPTTGQIGGEGMTTFFDRSIKIQFVNIKIGQLVKGRLRCHSGGENSLRKSRPAKRLQRRVRHARGCISVQSKGH